MKHLKPILKLCLTTCIIYTLFTCTFIATYVKKPTLERHLEFSIAFDYGDLYDNTDQTMPIQARSVSPVRTYDLDASLNLFEVINYLRTEKGLSPYLAGDAPMHHEAARLAHTHALPQSHYAMIQAHDVVSVTRSLHEWLAHHEPHDALFSKHFKNMSVYVSTEDTETCIVILFE